ncbi:MAG: DUF2628 domain-containing protein [Brevinematales bacterium]|nr:DUF2628 domain-containing protein [Brevinematales bacterium]
MDTTEMRKIFVGQNSDYYVTQWDLNEKTGIRMTANKAAFDIFWFFYRKMYLIGTGILLGLITISFIVQITLSSLGVPENISIQIGRIAGMVFWVFAGIKANYIYLKHVDRKIAKIKERNPENLEEELKRAGGVSVVALLLPIAMLAGYAAFLIWFISVMVKMI